MKSLLIIPAIFVMTQISNANEDGDYDEKVEMKQTAKEYRKCAEENKNAALDECEKDSPEIVKAAALKAVASRQKIGGIEEQLAAAYEAGDKKLVQKLHDQKAEAELEYEFSEKEKRAVRRTPLSCQNAALLREKPWLPKTMAEPESEC